METKQGTLEEEKGLVSLQSIPDCQLKALKRLLLCQVKKVNSSVEPDFHFDPMTIFISI